NPSAVGPAYAGDWELVLPGSSAIAKVQAATAKRIARRQRMILTLAPTGWDVTLGYARRALRQNGSRREFSFSERGSRQDRVFGQRMPQGVNKALTAFESLTRVFGQRAEHDRPFGF